MNPAMGWIVLVTVLALVQFTFFGALVSMARIQRGVPAPRMAGDEAFERLSRVHLNTLERLALFLPLLWLAAQSWPPQWLAALGAVYLVGRVLYWRGYVQSAPGRAVGNIVTMLPIGVLLVLNLVRLVQQAIA